jgi:hypothetical protein
MPAVAEVQFKAAGSQQVVTAFNSVGSAAQTSSTKIQQNSSAMKTMGQGMKSSISGIGQVTTAFATLSLSIVGTWRAYRDLGDAQIAVDKANLRVKKTTEAIRKLQADIAKDTKAQSKGGLDYAITQNKIRLAEEKLAKDRKDGKHSAAELRGEELALQKLRTEGVGTTKELADKQAKLGLLQEQLGVQTDVAKEAQERFNDTQQNFYLSIAPLAISTIGTLTTAFSGLKGMLTGGGGLIGGLGPIGLILGGITLAIIAFKTNFLGLRDAVGGVIKWLQDRFGAWKDTIQEVFGFIQKGDWSGAFNRIKEAAAAFWEDLKKSVPFFGGVQALIADIIQGRWGAVFEKIRVAAINFWEDLKQKVPFLAATEKFITTLINDIKNAKWGEAFQLIVDKAKEIFSATFGKGIAFLFGDNWKLGLDAFLAQQEAEASVNERPLVLQYALTINASIKAITGVDVLQWFKDHPITASIPFAGGITMLVEDPKMQANFKAGAKIIIDALGAALAAGAKILDPYVAKLVSALSWDNLVTAVNTAGEKIKQAGQAIWNFIFSGIKGGLQGQDWSKLFPDLNAKIQQAWKENAPDTQKAIIENWQKSPLAQGLAGLGIKFKPEVDMTDVSKKVNAAEIKIPTDLNTKPADKAVGALKNRTERQKFISEMKLNTEKADQGLNKFVKKVENTHPTMKINLAWGPSNVNSISRQLQSVWGGGKQHGYQSTVHRPTVFIAGEGGRPEDVTVRPRGSAQRGGSGGGGGGFYGTVNVYVDGVLRQARYSMGARK